MSLEFFSGFDAGEPMSEASFEKLREQMRAAAAQIQAIKKEEKKQKKKEDDLVRILLHFIKTSHKTDLILLISRVLEQNVPANFILAVILLGNEEIQHAVSKFLMLGGGEEASADEKSLVFFNPEDKSLPLKIKIEIDNWIKNMLSQAEEAPQKLMKTGYDIDRFELEREYEFDEPEYWEEKVPKRAIVKLITYVLRSFLESHGQEEPYEKLHDFSLFILTGILNKTAEGLDSRKLLAD